LNFINPEKNQYMYQMSGFDKDWIYAGTRRFVSYTNLDAGNYIFNIKGSNNDGLWNDRGRSLKIIITPPFWATWWFRTLSLLGIVGLILTWYQRRLKNVRMKTELQAAHDAQMAIMPQSDPQIIGFDISGVCIPANEVGGDFFDYIWADEAKSKFMVVIGDVSDKAMKAAMTAVMTSGIINSEARKGYSVEDIMTNVNRPLYVKTERDMFTALCLNSFDIKKKELTFVNAGLIRPILKSDDSIINLEPAGPPYPLGIFSNNIYQESTVSLKSGDIIIFLTDGIPEAQNHAKEFYGEKRLENLVQNVVNPNLSAKEIKKKIIEDVMQFSGTAPQFDDITIVVVNVL
jgi:serine phosphatase RsbU (regulator of sigma subunit)